MWVRVCRWNSETTQRGRGSSSPSSSRCITRPDNSCVGWGPTPIGGVVPVHAGTRACDTRGTGGTEQWRSGKVGGGRAVSRRASTVTRPAMAPRSATPGVRGLNGPAGLVRAPGDELLYGTVPVTSEGVHLVDWRGELLSTVRNNNIH